MYRGIKGTYIYACNKNLREYLKQNIDTYRNDIPFRILRFEDVKPYVNSIPFVDISVAAGNFSDLQSHSELTWIEPPFNISARKGYFICKVVGESMNKIIPNGSYCLFKEYQGGPRDGKIVLVKSTHISDFELGAGYTIKQYRSIKTITDDEWRHESIILKPMSTREEYSDLVLSANELLNFDVIGIFERVIE